MEGFYVESLKERIEELEEELSELEDRYEEALKEIARLENW